MAGAHCFEVAPVEAKVKEGRGRRRGTAGWGGGGLRAADRMCLSICSTNVAVDEMDFGLCCYTKTFRGKAQPLCRQQAAAQAE